MDNITVLKSFYEEIKKNNSIIFNFLKVSEFERYLFLSISKVINEKYDYELKGLTESHIKRIENAINMTKNDKILLNHAFELNTMIAKRTITMGYGGNSEKKITKNYKLKLFIDSLEQYIKEYESKNSI